MIDLPAGCLRALRETRGEILVLTGAGISAESGIPTFRGPEGYWTVGQVNYRPEELATVAEFYRQPEEIWGWYLYRRAVCARAEPNAGHVSLAALEQAVGDRLTLVTQNVDGLHLRAGNTLPRTWQIHGNIQFMRCADSCGIEPLLIPDSLSLDWQRHRAIGDEQWQQLRCPGCGGRARPHVLWFDECYDERHYRFDSSMRAANTADLLIVIGTSGATNLPMRIGMVATERRIPTVVINREPNPFSDLVHEYGNGWFLEGLATELIPPVVDALS